MGLASKDLCLVCNKVLDPIEVEAHVAQNRGHVTTEIQVWTDYEITEIDVTTSVAVTPIVTTQPTFTQADVLKNIYRGTDDPSQKARLANVVSAPFLSALVTANWELALYIAQMNLDAGVITEDDFALIVAAIPQLNQ